MDEWMSDRFAYKAAQFCFRQNITHIFSLSSMKKYLYQLLDGQVSDPNFISKNICSMQILKYFELQN